MGGLYTDMTPIITMENHMERNMENECNGSYYSGFGV